ncbi:alpha-N-acetylglucosaminidase-like isoform X1 [Ostrea edulis]|uniref:alpha-N-acetylglucosaminidase-like isoform X1 n=1 Tax=Ostrea edulis TaxID=37623 RepID=UPI0024AF06F5|nr:alpha-N-acetylglucosaminidase-like isoform X1 [Ostrea edulis]
MKSRNLFLLFINLILVNCKDFESLSHLKSKVSAGKQEEAAIDLFQRVLGLRAGDFRVKVQSDLGPKEKDTFIINTQTNDVEITGTTGVAAAMGLYYYLTNYCNCQITWGGKQLAIPSPLPKVEGGNINITTNDKFRFFQNVCTVSYSSVWYRWEQWESYIDWMAMRGINMALAFTGQEAMFQRVYMGLGFTMEDLQSHFGGPAFLAWSRMGNMHGWGGPITQSWIDDQLILQHKILGRMRSLGMIPVLPGFAGHVPEATVLRYPKANLSRLPDWASFNQSYCCNYLLDFNDPLFMKIAVRLIKEMEFEFGVDHVYSVDTFNEMEPRSNSTEYLALSGRTIYKSLKEADPKAIWLMQGWLFIDEGFWKPPQMKALLTSIPQGEMIILDLYSEIIPIFTRTDSYYGQPFIWCMLHNFGGTMEMYGALKLINEGPFNGRAYPNSSMVGLGMTPEGIFQNEVIYEFFTENVWRKEPRDVSTWISKYVLNRYGRTNKFIDLAWQYLKHSVYNNSDNLKDHDSQTIPDQRPRLSPQMNPDVWYNPEDLYVAWDIMTLSLDDFSNSSLFMYDIVDVSRNSLQILSIKYYTDLVYAFGRGDITAVQSHGDQLLGLLRDMDTLLGSDSHFLLGHWIKSATDNAIDMQDNWFLQFNARNQITLWGPRGEIRDYACKQWSGLIKDYYLPRWDIFVNYTLDIMLHNKTYNATELDIMIYDKVEFPFSYRLDQYPTEPQGDSVAIVKSLHKKYRPDTMSEFFQTLQKATAERHRKDRRNWRQRKYGSRTKTWKKHNTPYNPQLHLVINK